MAKQDEGKQPAVTPDNMLEHPATPPDMLHDFVTSRLANENLGISRVREDLHGAFMHPNVSAKTLSHAYSALAPATDSAMSAAGLDLSGNEHTDLLEDVMKHPNVPVEVAQDFLKRAYKVPRINFRNALLGAALDEAANHKEIPESFKEGLLNDLLTDDLVDKSYSVKRFQLHPDAYFSLLTKRPAPEPVTPRMTESQKKKNKYVDKLDAAVLSGLSTTDKHDKQSLERAVDFYTSQRAPHGMDPEERRNSLHSFVIHQKDIPSDALSKLGELKGSNGKDDWSLKGQIIEHPNVDPSFVAKVAQSSPTAGNTHPDDHWTANDTIGKAIASPKLPEQTRKSILGSVKPDSNEDVRKVSALLENPTTTKEDLAFLYQNGFDDTAIKDSRLPETLVNHYAEGKGSNTAGARKLLEREKLPESALLQLIGHKNQDVAVDALKHRDVNMNVIDAALKRKAKTVQDAASRHPLVAKQIMRDRLRNGQLPVHELLFDEKNKKAFGEMTPEDIAFINHKYQLDDPKKIEEHHHDDDFWKVKEWLANSDTVPASMREHNAKDIVDHFLRTNKEYDVIPAGSELHNDERDPFVRHKLARYTAALAANGNEYARRAALSRPYLLHELSLDRPTYDENYIRSAYSNMKQYDQKGLDVRPGAMAHEGGDRFFKDSKIKIGHNESTPEDVFDSLYHDPDYLSSPSGFVIDKDGNNTVFDKRWGGLPEDLKRERFIKLNTVNSRDAQYAMAISKQAPKDLWRQAYLGLNPNQRKHFDETYDVSEFADPQTRSEVLQGKHFVPYEYTSHNQTANVLSSLKPEKIEDGSGLDEFLNAYYNNQINNQVFGLNNYEISTRVDKGFFEGPTGEKRLREVFRAAPGLAARFADSVAGNRYEKDYQKFLGAMHSGTETMFPDEKSAEMQRRWRAALGEIGGPSYTTDRRLILSDYLGDPNDPNGDLDFLADMPEDIRERAIEQGLISHARVATEIAKTPSEIAPILRRLDNYQEARRVQELVDAPSLGHDTLRAIIPELHDASFTARKSGRGKITEQEFNKGVDYTKKLLDHTMFSVDPEYLTSNALFFLMTRRTTKNDHGYMSADTKKRLADQVIDYVSNRSGISPEQRNRILLSIADKFDEENITSIFPSSMKKEIVRNALAQGDIETLARAASKPQDLPSEAAHAIAEAFNSPEKLSTDQITALMNVASRKDISVGSIRKAFDILDDRANTALTAGDRVAYSATSQKIISAAKHGLRSMDSRDSNGDKGRVYLEKLMSYARSGDPSALEAQKALMRCVAGAASVFSEVSPEIFAGLPNDIEGFSDAHGQYGSMRISVLNDPTVISSATGGWKLAFIAAQAETLSSENATVITNRVINSDLPNSDKTAFAARLISNGDAQPQTVISALRAGGEDSVFTAVTAALNLEGNDDAWADSNLSTALGLMNSTVERSLDQESGVHEGVPFTKMDENHRVRLQIQLSLISETFKTNLTKTQVRAERGGTVGQIVDAEMESFTSNVGKFYHNVAEAFNSGKMSGGELSSSAEAFKYMVKNLSVTPGDISKSNALGFVEMTTYPERLSALAQEKDPNNKAVIESIKMDDTEMSGVLHKIITRTPFDKDDWQKAVSIQPLCAATLGYRNNIPAFMAEAINWDDFGDQTPVILGQWMPHISSEDAPRLVPKMLDHITSRFVSGQDLYSKPFDHALSVAIEKWPETISPNYMRSITAMYRNGQIKEDPVIHGVSKGAGGVEYCKPMLDSYMNNIDNIPSRFVELLADSPFLDSDHVEVMTSQSMAPISELSGNINLDSKSVSRIVKKVHEMPDAFASELAINNLIAHPNISKDDFVSLAAQVKLQRPQVSRAYFSNPKWGGEAFRNTPVRLPSLEGLDDDNRHVVVKEADYSAPRERLNKLLGIVPPEGMDWVTFKRANKPLENIPEIKSLFMSKKNNVVTPEDVVAAIKGHDDPFHVTYGTWSGSQLHANNENLVIQLNLSQKMESDFAQDPERWEFYQALTNAMMQSHPVTPRIAGWVRVDVSGEKHGWIAEEFQSDFDSIDQWIPQIVGTGSMKLNGKPVTEDQLEKHCKFIKQRLKNWHMAGMKAFEELAQKHGVRNLYIHGEGIRATLSGFDSDQDSPVKIKEMYDKTPQKLGWEKADYSDYPVQGSTGDKAAEKGYSTHVWKKKLE